MRRVFLVILRVIVEPRELGELPGEVHRGQLHVMFGAGAQLGGRDMFIGHLHAVEVAEGTLARSSGAGRAGASGIEPLTVSRVAEGCPITRAQLLASHVARASASSANRASTRAGVPVDAL